WNQFLRALENRGYVLRLNRKYITLQPPGKERPVRFKTLGKDYTPSAIRRRILYPERNSPAGNERALPPALCTLLSERPARKVTGLQKLYAIYLFQVG
ncbi:relaxase/mobilization nuclease domain-containing protein, partial [Ruthenibacterium lactatiformans]|nr:relaxase/mobilization nuclease domain-containing protein [Ruthenibacterium lactatiformans]